MIGGKVSLKTIIVIVVMLLVGVLAVLGMNTFKTFLSSASADYEPKNVVTTPGDDGKSAVISWQSDKPSMGVVEYGTTPASLLLRAVETTETTTHRISLTPLKAATSYYFRIKVGEEFYDSNGIPFSFKTKAASGETGGSGTISSAPVAPSPTMAVLPTAASSSGSVSCNRTTDYNGDGAVNSLDYLSCLRTNPQQVTIPPGTTLSPSKAVMPPAGGECVNTDYDKNGIINSIDRIKCLQNQQH